MDDYQPIFRAGLRSLLEAQPGVEVVAFVEGRLPEVTAPEFRGEDALDRAMQHVWRGELLPSR